MKPSVGEELECEFSCSSDSANFSLNINRQLLRKFNSDFLSLFVKPKGKLLSQQINYDNQEEEIPITKFSSIQEWEAIVSSSSLSMTSPFCRNPKENIEKINLLQNIKLGVPQEIRGKLWNYLIPTCDTSCRIKNNYETFLMENSPQEKQIGRDLARTFPSHDFFCNEKGLGQEALFNVMKAYSIFDKEVSYCQGLLFITGVLLLVMDERDAFSCLIRLMHHYNLRQNYTPGLEGLHLRLYQFDKILKDRVPDLFDHFQSLGVHSMMYASQWFLTLFAYKYPFEIVFCIFDVIFSEGIIWLYKISIALLLRNRETLLLLDFEEILEFLKNKLYYPYYEEPHQLIQDSENIQITQDELTEYSKEFTRNQILDSLDYFKSRTLLEENEKLKILIRKLEEKSTHG